MIEKFFKRETSLVLYDNETINVALGSFAQVEFDFFEIWEFKKTCKTFDPSKLHFLHVHPLGICECSPLDINCIQGFNIAFGSPVLFSIIVFNIFREEITNVSPTNIYCYRSFKYSDKLERVDSPPIKRDHLDFLAIASHI